MTLLPVDVEAARDFLGASSADKDRWAPLLERMEDDKDSAVASALSTPLMLSLALATYDLATAEPLELADSKRFPSEQAVELHLLGRVIPKAYDGVHHGAQYLDTEKIRRRGADDVVAATEYLTRIAELMGESTVLSWWRIKQWIPWLAPGATAFLFGASMGLVGMTATSASSALLFGSCFAISSSLLAGLIAWSGTAWRPRQMKGTTIRLAVACAVGGLFGLCLVIFREFDLNHLRGTDENVALGLLLGLGAGGVVGVVALHDGPLVAERRWPTRFDLGASIPLGLATGAVFLLTGPLWASSAVAFVANLGFMVGIAWARPAKQPGDGADPMTSFASDLRGSVTLGVAIGITVAASVTLALGEDHSWVRAGAIGLMSGAMFGVLSAIGTSQAIATTAVGAVLWLRNVTPFPLIWRTKARCGFLEDARERDIFRSVGCEYQFRHATLKEYLLSSAETPTA